MWAVERWTVEVSHALDLLKEWTLSVKAVNDSDRGGSERRKGSL
jgi:hypothetical protein